MIKEKYLIHLKLCDTWGFNEEVYSKIDSAIKEFKPGFYMFLNPTAFDLFFPIKFDQTKIMNLSSRLRVICENHVDNLEKTSLYRCAFQYSFESGLTGKIKSLPTGFDNITQDENCLWSLPEQIPDATSFDIPYALCIFATRHRQIAPPVHWLDAASRTIIQNIELTTGITKMDYIKAANINDFKNNRIKSVSILGRKVGIIKGKDSEFYAIEVGCKHQDADLTRGRISGDVATCPRHGWKFDLVTGECLNQNSSKLRRYGLKIEGDVILVTSRPLPEEEPDDPLLHFFD